MHFLMQNVHVYGWLIARLVFTTNFSSILAISWHDQIVYMRHLKDPIIFIGYLLVNTENELFFLWKRCKMGHKFRNFVDIICVSYMVNFLHTSICTLLDSMCSSIMFTFLKVYCLKFLLPV